MMINDKSVNNSPYVGSGQITREQFLFYEMRTTAKLLSSGLSDKEIIEKIIQENLFQYDLWGRGISESRSCNG